MTFDPSTLTNKRLWLRGKDLTLGATSVTSWPDQSGLSNNASGGTGLLSVIGGGTVVPTAAAASSNSGGLGTNLAAVGGTGAGYNVGWETNGGAPGWLRADLAAATVVTSYSFGSRPSWTTRAPTAWTFEGSNDASNWTVLDTRSGITGWVGGDIRGFSFSNANAYLYYRLNVSATGGGSPINLMELRLATTSHNLLEARGGSMSLTSDTVGTQRDLWMVVHTHASSSNSFTRLGTSGNLSHFPYTDGNVYIDAFLPTRRSFTPTMGLVGVTRLLRISMSSAGVWTAYVDGVQQNTASGQTFSLSTTPQLVGGWAMQIAEALILDAPADATTTANLIGYFNAEHGLSVPGGATTATLSGAASLSAASTLTATAVDTTTAADALAATSSLGVTGTATRLGADTLSATALLTAAAVDVVQVSNALSAASALAVSAGVTEAASAALSATTSLAVTPSLTELASVALSASSALLGSGTIGQLGNGTLVSLSSLTVSSVTSRAGNIALSSASALSATPIFFLVIPGSASLVASSTMTNTAALIESAVALLSSTSVMAAQGDDIKLAMVSTSALSILSAEAHRGQFAALSMDATSMMVLSATFSHLAVSLVTGALRTASASGPLYRQGVTGGLRTVSAEGELR